MIRRTPMFLLLLLFSIGLSGIGIAQSGDDGLSLDIIAHSGGDDGLSLDTPLPRDPAVRVGKLSNGMTYYVRQNGKPEDRAELRLAVRAGSILEDDDQRGFAHFVEHMAFNGTENFPKNDMIAFLESIGMRFGADLNAYTSFDETIYMLQVPTDDKTSLDGGMKILRDWASTIKFEGDAIDAERGVVIEEWRSRRSGDSRVNDDHFKVIYEGSRYADRSPIGTYENLKEGSHDAMRRFYRDWYRPDLMAVIAVGDFDPDVVENKIKTMFSGIAARKDPREREVYDIPVHEDPRYSISFDPEASSPSVQFIVMHDRARRDRHGDYRRGLLEQMVSGMLSQRLDELRQQADPPFVYAFGGAGLGLGMHRQFSVNSRVKDGEYLQGLEAILTEVERIRRHGFTSSELERMKNSMMTGIEQYYAEKDKNESGNYAREYYSNYTSNEPFPGIDYEYQMYQWYVPEVSLEEINEFTRDLLKTEGRIITVGGPKREGMKLPTEDDLEEVVEDVMDSDIEPYAEEAIADILMESKPKAGKVVSEKRIEELGVTEWKLSNGARVVLKPTDFKNDEIWLSAYSPGGTSLISDNDYIAASTASTLMSQGGVGGFDRNSLNKFLSDKNANVSTSIEGMYETVSGASSKKDMETMFQLLYLSFTAPRKDETALLSYKARLEGLLETQGSRPEQVFSDTVSYVSSGYHYRSRPWTVETLDDLDLNSSYAIYQDRFANAGDFTFFIVGSFDEQAIKPMVETYIASLPAVKRQENWKDVGVQTPKGKVKRVIEKGVEEKGQVQMTWTGDFDWSMENRYEFQSMIEVLRMKLRETLREDKGGVYSPNAWGSYDQYPKSEYNVNIFFGCDPHRVDELISDVQSIITSLKTEKVDKSYIEKVQEIHRRQRETQLTDNRFWISSLQFYYQNGEDPTNLLQWGELYKTLTPEMIQQQAKKYFGENLMTFILVPERK